jgi:hypothetical protein
MTYRDLSDPALVDFGKNVHQQVAAHKVSTFSNALADALAAALAPVNTNFETSIEAAVVATAAKEAAVATKDADRVIEENGLSDVLLHLASTHATKADYELLGFPYPKKSASPVVAQDPTNLTAVGTSNGVNTLEFEGNNKSGDVTYEIWRRQGDEGAWGIIGTTRKQVYEDKPVTPGQYYEYKVRAIAAKTTSNYSNSAVVYGAP